MNTIIDSIMDAIDQNVPSWVIGEHVMLEEGDQAIYDSLVQRLALEFNNVTSIKDMPKTQRKHLDAKAKRSQRYADSLNAKKHGKGCGNSHIVDKGKGSDLDWNSPKYLWQDKYAKRRNGHEWEEDPDTVSVFYPTHDENMLMLMKIGVELHIRIIKDFEKQDLYKHIAHSYAVIVTDIEKRLSKYEPALTAINAINTEHMDNIYAETYFAWIDDQLNKPYFIDCMLKAIEIEVGLGREQKEDNAVLDIIHNIIFN